MDPLDNFSVLLLDESETRQDLLSTWIAEVKTRTVSSPAELSKKFDSTVAVVCLSQSALGEHTETVRKFALSRNPYCQLIGVLPRSSFVSPFEDEFDDILQRPVFKDEFQETIEYRLIAGVYTYLLSEFYDVNSTLVALERASASDIADRDDSLARVRDREETLKQKLDSLRKNLSSDMLMNILQTIERHNRSLKSPDQDIAEGKETKFRPRRCPSCNLPWGVHHRNDLGKGYKKLGADVYQCARCDKIVHGLAGDHRIV